MHDSGDASSDPSQKRESGPDQAGSYWGERTGLTPRRDVRPPPPTGGSSAAGHPPSHGAPPDTTPAQTMPPPIASERLRPAYEPSYGTVYRPPNTRKNWTIGIVAALVLAAAILVPILLVTSSTQNVLQSAFALPSSGSNTVAWYWGGNPFAGSNSAKPLNIGTSQDFTTIVTSKMSDSYPYFVALDRRGIAYEWGTPSLPNSPLMVAMTPTAVAMPPGVRFTSISTNQAYVLAIDQTGRLWEWGDLSRVEASTGVGSAATSQSPVAVPTPAGVTFRAISAGWNFSLALDSTGHAWAWGENESYDLGVQTNQTPISTPTPIDAPAGVTFTAISAGLSHSVALDSSGRAWSWGDNEFGELGVNASAVQAGPCGPRADCSATPVPVDIPADVHLIAVAAGEDYTAAVDSSGDIWTWGTNDHGALGLAGSATTCALATSCAMNGPTQPTNSVPAEVKAPAGVRFVAVAVTQGNQSGEDATIALDNHGVAWAWGSNLILQFNGGEEPCYSPENQAQSDATGVELCMLTPSQLAMPAGVTFKSVTASTDVLLGFPR